MGKTLIWVNSATTWEVIHFLSESLILEHYDSPAFVQVGHILKAPVGNEASVRDGVRMVPTEGTGGLYGGSRGLALFALVRVLMQMAASL